MKLSEMVTIINDPTIHDDFNYILNKINHNIHKRFGTNDISFPEKPLKRRWFPKIGARQKKSSKDYFLTNPASMIPIEDDINVEFEYIFYGGKGMPSTAPRVKIPPTFDWKLEDDIKKDDIYDIILLYQKLRKEEGKPELTSKFLHRLALYITEILNHPLDALHVDEEMTSGLGKCYSSGKTDRMNLVITKFIGLCIALKYKVKIDYAKVINIINDIKVNNSIMRLRTKPIEELKTCKEIMSTEAKLMYSFVKDGEAFMAELDYLILSKREYSTITNIGSDMLYYLFAILLDHGTNAWHEIPLIIIEKLKRYYEQTPIDSEIKKTSIDYLFTNKTKVKSPFYYIGFTEFTSNEHRRNLFPQKTDEIKELFENYRIYLTKLGVLLYEFDNAQVVCNHRPLNMKKLSQLTKENIEKCCINYIEHVEKEDLSRVSCRNAIIAFLKTLVNMKDIFEKENILGTKPKTILPFNEKLLKIENLHMDDNEKITVYGRLIERIKQGPKKLDENDEASKEITSNYKGTFKEDIIIADEVVRAIYDFKPKAEEGTIEYFYEYQYTTMLRIAADSGCRIEEVINAPYGTLSYLKEYDVDICILGLSKLGERFGVVPVGKETAKMIQKCADMRMKLFPKSKVYLEMKGHKGKYETKYVMQFIKYGRKGIMQVQYKDLQKHIDIICKEKNITLSPNRRFHFLRHRAAEYFFFAMSYYDFEYKDNVQYKNSIVKRLLRHRRIKMTEEYVWSDLLNLLSEKKLIFLRDLKQLEEHNPKNSSEHQEKLLLIQSLKMRIEKNLEEKLTEPGIKKIILLLSSPLSFLEESSIETLNKTQDFANLLNSLRRVDGEKSEGTVPAGAAYFGKCLNSTCWRVKERITCVSCEDHLIENRDIPRMIGEIIKCHLRIETIYKDYDATKDHKEQLRSLRSRIATCTYRLHNELKISERVLIEKLEKYIIDNMSEQEVQLNKFIEQNDIVENIY